MLIWLRKRHDIKMLDIKETKKFCDHQTLTCTSKVEHIVICVALKTYCFNLFYVLYTYFIHIKLILHFLSSFKNNLQPLSYLFIEKIFIKQLLVSSTLRCVIENNETKQTQTYILIERYI